MNTNNFFNISSVECKIKETINLFEFTFDKNDINLNILNIENIIAYIKMISSRDTYELRLVIDGVTEYMTNLDDENKILDHFQEYNNKKVNLELCLTIKKNGKNNIFSIYSFDSFIKFIESKSFKEFIELFANILNDNITFEVLDDDFNKEVYTNSIAFVKNDNDKKYEFKNLDRNEKLKLLNENKIDLNFDYKNLIADDFHILYSENTNINTLFKKIKLLLSFSAITNKLYIEANNKFNIKINGYKTIVNNDLSIDSFYGEDELLYEIYKWAYDGGNGFDKIGLIRNVISLHVNDNGIIELCPEVFDAIHSNYQIYLRENIQSYLEVKNKIGEFILEVSTKTYLMVDEIINTFKNNIILLLTFIITVVIVNGIKDNGIDKIFSLEYAYVISFLSIISLIWFCVLKYETKKRFKKATSNIKSILVRNYSKIIMESEIDSTLKPVISNNGSYINKQSKNFFLYLLGIIILINLFFWIGYFSFSYKNNSFTVNTSSKTLEVLLKDEKNHLLILDNINQNISKKLIDELRIIKSLNIDLTKENKVNKDKIDKLIEKNKSLQKELNNLK